MLSCARLALSLVEMQRLSFAVAVALACIFVQWPLRADAQTYVVDDTVGLGRQFDGIGGLSGGGVSLYLNIKLKSSFRIQVFNFARISNVKLTNPSLRLAANLHDKPHPPLLREAHEGHVTILQATSRLLVSYDNTYSADILDLLFTVSVEHY